MMRDELIEAVRAARARWDALLARIDVERLVERGVAGDWSLKDIVAHIAWFENEMVGVIRARALVGSDLWELPPHERNDAIHELNRDRSLEDVLDGAARTYQDLLEALQILEDADLPDAARFADMPPDWVPLEIIAQNTYLHYDAHRAGVEAWLG